MADNFESPVDVTEAEQQVLGLGHMAVTVGVALFTCLMLNAHALAAWAHGLAPGARNAAIGTLADGLADRTAARGFDAPRAALKSGWDQAKAARWRGQQDDQR